MKNAGLEFSVEDGIYYISKNGEHIAAADRGEVQFQEDGVCLNKKQLLAIADKLEYAALRGCGCGGEARRRLDGRAMLIDCDNKDCDIQVSQAYEDGSHTWEDVDCVWNCELSSVDKSK